MTHPADRSHYLPRRPQGHDPEAEEPSGYELEVIGRGSPWRCENCRRRIPFAELSDSEDGVKLHGLPGAACGAAKFGQFIGLLRSGQDTAAAMRQVYRSDLNAVARSYLDRL